MVWWLVSACGGEGPLAVAGFEEPVDECHLPCLAVTGAGAGVEVRLSSGGRAVADGGGAAELCPDAGSLAPGTTSVTVTAGEAAVEVAVDVRPFGWQLGRDREPGTPGEAGWYPELVRPELPWLGPQEDTWFAWQLSGPELQGELLAVAGTPSDEATAEEPNSYFIGVMRVDEAGVAAVSEDWVLPPADWDAYGQNSPSLLRTAEGWTMWYHGVRTAEGGLSIGRATSADGFDWTPDPANPRFEPTGDEADFDGTLVAHPSVLASDEGLLELWYAGGRDLGFALSADGGETWERACTGPLLTGGGQRIKTPEVVWAGDRYLMTWALGDEHAYDVFWGESLDGLRWWTSAGPVLPRGETPWDDKSVSNGQILLDGERVSLLYAGVGASGSGLGLAVER